MIVADGFDFTLFRNSLYGVYLLDLKIAFFSSHVIEIGIVDEVLT